MAEKDLIQTFVPMQLHGRTTMVPVNVDRATARDYAFAEEETLRREGILKRRLYVGGRQYDEENALSAEAKQIGRGQRIPEHLRKHAYSTQIGECIGFLANRLGEGFAIEADDSKVEDVVNALVRATDTLTAFDDEGNLQVVTDDVLWEALAAGDVPVYIGWDPVEERVYWEFWESEIVSFEMATATVPKRVTRTELIWATDAQGVTRQMTERMVYDMAVNEVGVMEARKTRFLDEQPEPVEPPEWLGVGTIPWRILRADKKGLRAFRGDSMITEQAMETADRFNAVEQTGYLISRYNSHSNVAVIGDGATLKLEQDGRVSKDVADVLTFPGGTALQVLTLPTDPQMIEHQREVLAEALHSSFGITRVEPSTLTGLGQVSGYALEILNQKTEGTFSRIRRNWRKDFLAALDASLDVHAWKSVTAYALFDPRTLSLTPWTPPTDPSLTVAIPEGSIPMAVWWEVDPASVYPNRKIAIRLGSGYIVDDVKVRDDFVADLISREEALRQRGMDDTRIKKIIGEIDKRADKESQRVTQETGTFGADTQAGGTVAGTTARDTTTQEPAA